MKIISVNIQGNLQVERWIPWVKSESPDIFCLQEVYEDSFYQIQKEFGYYGEFYTMSIIPKEFQSTIGKGTSDVWGLAMFSKTPIHAVQKTTYAGSPDDLTYRWHDTCNRAVIVGMVTPEDGKTYPVATTHFTWSNEGLNTNIQYNDWKSLVSVLSPYTELLLCGDMNVPRGSPLATLMTESFKDCIPAKYDTSLDPVLHRAGHLKRMVDYLFIRGALKCDSIELVQGVSDHMGIVAQVTKP
jgi:endonuclease/exonuclease/phosphatase family metal-dependent hydrolase